MKPRLMIAAFLLIALAIPATMLAQGNKGEKEKEVRAVLEELTQANLKGGAEAATIIDKLVTDDYTVVIGSGAAFTKSEVLNAWRTGQQRSERYDVQDVKIRLYGNTAVATGILNSKSAGALTGLPGQLVQARFTRIFVKRGGNWQCVLYHQTRIAEPAKQ